MSWVRMPTGLVVPEVVAEEYARRWRRPVAVDLFCGCGGFSLGLIQAGFRVLCAVDNDPDAVLVYLHNLGTYPVDIRFVEESDRERLERRLAKSMKMKRPDPETGLVPGDKVFTSGGARPPDLPGVPHFIMGDVRKLSGRDILQVIGLEVGELDLLVGSPPCQGFSRANTRRSSKDPRNDLVLEFARLVVEMRPKAVCMENVPGIVEMTTREGVPVMDAFCRVLEDGSWSSWRCLQRVLKAQKGIVLTRQGRRGRKSQGRQRLEAQHRQKSLFADLEAA